MEKRIIKESFTVDTAIAVRIAYLLTTNYENWPAYQYGIIDKKGKLLKQPSSTEEKEAWTPLHRLVWRIRQLIAKLPGGDSLLARLGTTYFLMKENKEWEPVLKVQLKKIIELYEETTTANVAGANVNPGEGLGCTVSKRKTLIIRRKQLKTKKF